MRYLIIHEDGSMEQTEQQPDQSSLEMVHSGQLEIVEWDPKRGYCRLITSVDNGSRGNDIYERKDWERLPIV